MDFTEPKAIGRDIEALPIMSRLCLQVAMTITLFLDNKGEVELAASLYDSGSGRYMEVFTR